MTIVVGLPIRRNVVLYLFGSGGGAILTRAWWWRVGLGVLAGSAIVGVIYVGWIVVLFVGFATSNPCGYRLTGQQVSPDGAVKAGVVQVDCGATTGLATWAVLTPAGKAFDYRKDRVVAIDGEAMRIGWEGRKLVVSWRSPHLPNVRRSDLAPVEVRPL